ncbi:phosphomannomutase/phosphoglucomutase [Listeria valentina]|uniref:phosphomannomutase/phosphoglucomutase n=1 Tax=Listeria valentina TaxID=2705293 RepID=UPI0014309A3A|nr:phosphomannomutase/phosphoglucomutase [Listeria valentina]
MEAELSALQNGSDIRGIGLETEEHQMTLTDEALGKIARGILRFLQQTKTANDEKLVVAIGHDSRLSAARIKAQLVAVLKTGGVTILDAGLATTPALFMATQYESFQADAGIMITASHLPYFYNGIKLFTKAGGAEKEDIQFILENGESNIPQTQAGSVKKIDLMDTYAADLVAKIRDQAGNGERPLAGSRIVVDAGNGAGGFFASKVLEPLGADTTGSQFLDPDGHFPNHIPNPDNDEAMASLRAAVLENKADLGIIFDTDVDRAAIVDKFGDNLNRNALIAVISAIILETHPGSTIVTDSTTSNHLEAFIQDLGGKQHRFKRGYRNVINEAIRLNEAGENSELAIEVSGHAALKENYFLDDGAYLVAKILVKYAKLKQKNRDLSDLTEKLVVPALSHEFRIQIKADDFKAYGEDVLTAFRQFVQETAGLEIVPVNYEGVRVNLSNEFGSGWLLLRMSLHEPVMPLNMELDQEGTLEILEAKLHTFFADYPKLVLPF